jgi:multiple antibiotic resistance protein
MSLSSYLVALSAVFFVVDPIGVVPVFLAVTPGETQERIHKIALRASVIGALLLVVFALFGAMLFKLFGVSLAAFRVAGGILLLITSLDMLRARRSPTRSTPEENEEARQKEDVAVVPLAVPLLAGPGSIATVMVLMSSAKTVTSALPVMVGIALTFLASYLILRGASYVQRVLKASGVAILQRVMGLILASIAVQFMADGARTLLGR